VTARATVRSRIGPVTVEATDGGLCGIALRGTGRARPAVTLAEQRHLDAGLAALRAYFRGRPPRKLPAFDLAGSDFDRRVWQALLDIPWGETCTYGALAARIGAPGAARAVGAAVGRNPIPILIPCHRVVAAGGLGGYSGGAGVKRWLLAHEAGHAPALRAS
jgi:methylated-DNA-[protein]-cysteine S-methyltransferase